LKNITLNKRLFSIEETAEYLGLSPKTIRNRLGPRSPNPFPVKPKRIGKRVLFDVRDLDSFVDSLEAR
jgi:predicted DNA-binding transcriptional regulator AlpA